MSISRIVVVISLSISLMLSIGICESTNFSETNISDLSLEQRQALYEKSRIHMVPVVLLSSFVGFGTGYFIQSESGNGLVSLFRDLITITLSVAGIGMIAAGSMDDNKPLVSTGIWVSAIGIPSFIFSRVYEIVTSIEKAKNKNEKLKKGLRLIPIISFEHSLPQFQFAIVETF